MKSDSSHFEVLDLRGTPCPINFIRCRLLLEELSPNDCLQVDLDKGEPELTVIPGLKDEGHRVEVIDEGSTWIRLMVVCGAQ